MNHLVVKYHVAGCMQVWNVSARHGGCCESSIWVVSRFLQRIWAFELQDSCNAVAATTLVSLPPTLAATQPAQCIPQQKVSPSVLCPILATIECVLKYATKSLADSRQLYRRPCHWLRDHVEKEYHRPSQRHVTLETVNFRIAHMALFPHKFPDYICWHSFKYDNHVKS